MNLDAFYGYALVFVVLWVPVTAIWLGGLYVGRRQERRRWEKQPVNLPVATGGNDVDDFVEGVTRHMREP